MLNARQTDSLQPGAKPIAMGIPFACAFHRRFHSCSVNLKSINLSVASAAVAQHLKPFLISASIQTISYARKMKREKKKKEQF